MKKKSDAIKNHEIPSVLKNKQFILIAGPNGAGKTTGAFVLLPHFFKTHEFVNADEIARGLSPLKPNSMDFRAGKIMLQRIRELIDCDQSFAVETTLSGRIYQSLISNAKSKNYQIGIIFLYLNSVTLAQKRVEQRVAQGGHNIPSEIIERRYLRGIKNLVHTYLPISDWAYIFDNSSQNEISPKPIYFKNQDHFIENKILWEKINEQARR